MCRFFFSNNLQCSPELGWIEYAFCAYSTNNTIPTLHNIIIGMAVSPSSMLCDVDGRQLQIMSLWLDFFSWMLLGDLFSCIKCVFRMGHFVDSLVFFLCSYRVNEPNWNNCAFWMPLRVLCEFSLTESVQIRRMFDWEFMSNPCRMITQKNTNYKQLTLWENSIIWR